MLRHAAAFVTHAAAFVTHAGMGSTMEGLHFEVPMVAIPQMAEQRANADRLAELRLGRTLPPEPAGADTLWTAIAGVVADEHIGERLTWMRRDDRSGRRPGGSRRGRARPRRTRGPIVTP